MPEYAEVYGVPFSFIPSAGSARKTRSRDPTPTRVRALEDRIACEITFPRLVGYRYRLKGESLEATFTPDSMMAISTADLPTKTEMQSIIGESSFHDLYGLKEKRLNEVDFRLAALLLEEIFQECGREHQALVLPAIDWELSGAGGRSA